MVKDDIDRLLEAGFIYPVVNSEWVSPIVVVVGTQNINKRKESTRIREVCSSCQFFLAKQRYFYLARRVSKFRTNPSSTKVN